MNLKRLYIAIHVTTIILLAVMGILTFLMLQNEIKINRSQETLHKALMIADELRKSSDDLTHFCRAYVVTGDTAWENRYWEVLDIRNGARPRPDGRTIALRDSMESFGFEATEFEKLKEAEQYSNELVWTERVAFSAIKGLFDDGTGQLVKKGDPDSAFARRIMFDEKYHSDRIKILTPIDEFIVLLDQRTHETIDRHERISSTLLFVIIGLVVVTISLAGFSYFIIRNKIIQQMEESEKSAERADQSEGQFRGAFETAAHGMALVSSTGRFLGINQAFCDIVGYSRDEMLAIDLQKITHPGDLDANLDKVQQLLAGQIQSYQLEERYYHKQGHTVWVLLSVSLVRDRAGNPVHFVSQAIDITERKQAQIVLQDNEERLRDLYEAMAQGVVFQNSSGKITRANPAAEKILGLTFDQMQGRTSVDSRWRSLREDGSDFPGDEHPAMVALRTGKKVSNTVMGVFNPDTEKLCWITVNAVPQFRQGEDTPYQVFATFDDITDLKRAESELLGHVSFSTALLEAVPVAVFYKDAEGCYLGCNSVFTEIMGVTASEIEGRTVHEIWPGEHAETYHEKDLELMRDPSHQVYEFEVRDKRGDVRPVIYAKNVFRNDRGEVAGIVGAFLDISERKQAEQERHALERQVQHAQKLESLGVLAGGIAHDFNNIVMTILGNADLALDGLSPMSPAVMNIQEIEKAAKRAAELAKQMLAYSGKGRFVIEAITPNELVQETAHLLEVSISKKSVLRYNFAENLPTFQGDATQIRQILMNLITNASEAIGDRSGVIALSTGAMDCDDDYLNETNEVLRTSLNEPLAEGIYTYVEVADTGCGMDAETMEKIFDPFFTTKFAGRGLGMSAVLGIVRGHKGALKLYSEVGKGTTFKVLFPADELSNNGLPVRIGESGVSKDWRGSGTVLLVDDEESVRAVGKSMLERMGFDVLTASDGRDAVQVFGKQHDKIVCVLLDLTMPHMDGEEAFREMRRIDPAVTVIICSGYNEQDATQRFSGKGLANFIQKPYNMAGLKAILMESLPESRK